MNIFLLFVRELSCGDSSLFVVVNMCDERELTVMDLLRSSPSWRIAQANVQAQLIQADLQSLRRDESLLRFNAAA